MKYEDLAKVNSEIKTTNIKGKDYAEVNERINAFRKLYPEGFILTELISCENGVCIFKAKCGFYCTDADGFLQESVLGEGHAEEKEDSSFINKTSYIENCETSAVGRALGNAGFGIETSVASADEVQNAINNQGEKPDERAMIKAEIQGYADANGLTMAEIAKDYQLNAHSTADRLKEVLADLKGGEK